jgi:hypothetical protein
MINRKRKINKVRRCAEGRRVRTRYGRERESYKRERERERA